MSWLFHACSHFWVMAPICSLSATLSPGGEPWLIAVEAPMRPATTNRSVSLVLAILPPHPRHAALDPPNTASAASGDHYPPAARQPETRWSAARGRRARRTPP